MHTVFTSRSVSVGQTGIGMWCNSAPIVPSVAAAAHTFWVAQPTTGVTSLVFFGMLIKA